MKWLISIALILSLCLVSGCGSDDPPPPTPTPITIDANNTVGEPSMVDPHDAIWAGVEQVTLDIFPYQRERRGDDSASVEQASTSISGYLGRWMAIGGVDSSAVHDSSRIGSSRTVTTSRRSTIYVKVETISE
jgi:hypothetical protein